MKKVLILIFFIFSAHSVHADFDHYLAKDIESEIKTFLVSQLLNNYDIELIRLLEISEMRFKNIDDLLVKSTGRAELIKVLGEFKAVRNLNTSFRTDENGEMVASPTIFKSSSKGQREFCSNCGTQICFRAAGNAETVDVNSGALDEIEAVPPDHHIYVSSKVPWLSLNDGLCCYEQECET